MKNILKNEKGLSGVDIVISIGIITLFATIIATIFSNLYVSNTRAIRQQAATNYAIQILEKVDELYYSEVTDENFEVKEIENGKHQVAGIEISKGYNVNISIEKYNENFDVIKTVKVNIQYKVGKKDETLEMQKIKKKEILTIPNKPVVLDGLTPVKYIQIVKNVYSEEDKTYKKEVEKKLVETTEKDQDWYDYSNKKWAMAIKDSNKSDIYVWIPRFAYHLTDSNSDIRFIYSNGERYVDENGDLKSLNELGSSYTIPTDDFDVYTGFWVKISKIGTTYSANILNTNHKYGPMSN